MDDRKDLSFQQKLWIFGRSCVRGGKPFLLYLLMPSLCVTIGYSLFHRDIPTSEFFAYGGNFYTALGMILTIWVLHLGSKKRGHKFFEDATLYLENIDKKKAACFAVFGVASAITISAVLTLLPRWGAANAYSEASQTMYKGYDIVFTIITTVITSPLLEEIVFRGYMLNIFLEAYGEKFAIFFVSAVFAICHGEILWMLYAFGMGLILAWVSIKEDNIFYSVALHVGFNAPSAVAWLIRSFPAASGLIYGNKWLVLGYGLIGGMTAALLIRYYFKDRTKK